MKCCSNYPSLGWIYKNIYEFLTSKFISTIYFSLRSSVMARASVCGAASQEGCRFETEVQCSLALIFCGINTVTKPAPSKNHHRFSIHWKLNCWCMYQRGNCSTLNIVNINNQKQRNMSMVHRPSDANSRGGHWSPTIFHFYLWRNLRLEVKNLFGISLLLL